MGMAPHQMETRNLGPDSEEDGGSDMVFQWSEGNREIVSDLRSGKIGSLYVRSRPR